MRQRAGLIPHLPRDAWVVLGGDALSAVGSGLTLPFFIVYLSRVRGIEIETAAAALSTIALASFAGNPLGGSLSDRYGPRRALILGLLVAAVGSAAMIFVRVPWHAFAAAGSIGLGASIVWPSQDALLATVVRPEQRSSVFSVRHATLNAGFGVGGLVAAVIVDLASPGSFELVYLIDAVTFFLFVPVLLVIPAIGRRVERADDESVAVGGYRDLLRDRIFVRLWGLTALLVFVGYGMLNSALPAFAADGGGITAGALGIVFAANTVTIVVAQLPVLRAARGHRRTRAVVLLCGFWAATWLLVPMAGVFDGGAPAVAIFAVAAALFAIGETLLSPTLPAMVNDIAPDRLRGRYNGAYTLAWTLGFFVAPLVGGSMLGAGRSVPLFVGLAVACGLAALGALRLERHLPRDANLIAEDEAVPLEPAAEAIGPVPVLEEGS